MAEPDHSSPSTSTSTSVNRESSGAAATASSSSSSWNSSPVSEEDDTHNHIHVHHDHQFREPEQELEHQNVGFSYRENFSAYDEASAIVRDDTWSCIIVVLTFWFFVSMTLILGVYGAANVKLGPNASVLIEANPLFVQTVKVEELNEIKPGPTLYGFYKSPPLDVVTSWSESYSVSLAADSHKEWIHFLNRGSEINISYSVKSPSSSVFLIIAQGNEGLAQWLEDPTYPNTTLAWNVIHGSGVIHQDIYTSSSYYIALGNLNSEEVEVQLNVGVKALLYNTTEAYYKCTFTQGVCNLSVLFPKGNSIVLASPGTEKLQNAGIEDWYVRVSYGPRWLTYVVGIGAMTVLMYVAFNFLNKFRWTRENESQYGNIESARAPLLPYKDDDLSSWGSSYDSVSNDEEDLEEFLAASYPEGKSVRDGENGNNTRRLCAICFDAPRDCFFLPCGHCVACFECGTRIAEAAGTCPVCRRNMKKVRKIFTV